MNSKILDLIENKDLVIKNNQVFTAIIGLNPSKNARSPILWNKAFKKFNKECKMFPLDVNEKKLILLLDQLNLNQNFLGGAITIPHKTSVAEWLNNNISGEAKKIGAVNCLYRSEKESNSLLGTNTDGEASISTFLKKFKDYKSGNILLLGCGGAGKAVATFFSKKFGGKNLTILSRNQEDKLLATKLNSSWVFWNDMGDNLEKFNLIINCTSLGFDVNDKKMPLRTKQFKKLKKNTIFFDIIYNPKQTLLLEYASKLNLRTFNGLNMNLEQAAIAFRYVNAEYKFDHKSYE